MKTMRMTAALVLSAAAVASTFAAEEADVEALIKEFTGEAEPVKRTGKDLQLAYAKVVASLAPAMGVEDINQRKSSQATLERMCHEAGAPGNEARRAALSKAMCAHLGAKTPLEARVWLLRMLQHVGGPEAVAPVADLLDDEAARVRECARRALQANTSKAAGAALRAALSSSAEPAWRVAIINALGYRRDGEAADEIAKGLSSKDASVAAASASALGKIGGTKAAAALKAARARAAPDAAGAITDAWLRCADTLLAAGETDEATAIYREVHEAKGPSRFRIAAMRGLVAADPEASVPLVTGLLRSEDREMRRSAAVFVREVPGADVTRAFAAELEKLSGEGKTILLSALGERGDRAARPAVEKAAGDDSPAVRLAALKALAAVGDAGSVDLLGRVAAGSDSADERAAAKASLARLGGQGVDRAIVARMPSSKPAVRVVLIGALAARRATSATPALLGAAADKDASVRTAALSALGVLAGVEHLPALVELLSKAGTDPERDAAGKAIVGACSRIKDKSACASAIVSGLKAAPVPARAALLRLLPSTPAPSALKAVRAAIKNKDDAVRDAAVRALADWPTAEVVDDLLALAGGAGGQTHQVLALRGAVRVLGLPSRRSGSETVELYAKAMKLAARPAEKKLVLAGLSGVGHIEALKPIRQYMDDPALAGEAMAAAVKVARAAAGGDRDRALSTLETIHAKAEDKRTKKAAADAISHINRHVGYIATWMLAGPYTKKGKSGPSLHDVSFPPEAGAKDVEWRRVTAKDGVVVDLSGLVGGENCCAYLRVSAESPSAQPVRLEIGSDDGVKVWVNDKLVHDHSVSRGVTPGEDKAEAALRKGPNTILMKVYNGSGPWGACLRVLATGGKPVEGLRTTAE